MKKLLTTAAALILTFTSNAQDCKGIQKGKFRVAPDDYSPSETIITRTNEHQFEEVISNGIKMQFDLKWTSDCTYELSNPKLLKGELPWKNNESHKLFVKIIKVTKTSYTTEITSNFFDTKLVKEIQIL